MDEYKQVIVVRQDLKLPKGKLAVQVAHGSVEAVMNSSKEKVDTWRSSGMKKSVVKATDLKELLEIQRIAKSKGLIASIIKDAGKTVLTPGTVTVLAVGPDKEELVDSVTGSLPLI